MRQRLHNRIERVPDGRALRADRRRAADAMATQSDSTRPRLHNDRTRREQDSAHPSSWPLDRAPLPLETSMPGVSPETHAAEPSSGSHPPSVMARPRCASCRSTLRLAMPATFADRRELARPLGTQSRRGLRLRPRSHRFRLRWRSPPCAGHGQRQDECAVDPEDRGEPELIVRPARPPAPPRSRAARCDGLASLDQCRDRLGRAVRSTRSGSLTQGRAERAHWSAVRGRGGPARPEKHPCARRGQREHEGAVDPEHRREP